MIELLRFIFQWITLFSSILENLGFISFYLCYCVRMRLLRMYDFPKLVLQEWFFRIIVWRYPMYGIASVSACNDDHLGL